MSEGTKLRKRSNSSHDFGSRYEIRSGQARYAESQTTVFEAALTVEDWQTDEIFRARIRQLAQSEMNRYEALRKIDEHQARRADPDTTAEDMEVRLELSRQKLQKLFDTLRGKGYGIDMLRAEFTGEFTLYPASVHN